MLMGLYQSVFTVFIGAFIAVFIPRIYKYLSEKRSPLTDDWITKIYDDKGQVVKSDIIHLAQHGEDIYGEVLRLQPNQENQRKWVFRGKIRDRQLVAFFWSKSADVLSYGCGYFTQIDVDRFVGQYISLQYIVDDKGNFAGRITPTRGSMERKRTVVR